MTSRARLLRRVVLALVVATVAAELALQIAYAVVFVARPKPAAMPDHGLRVLCVGDSFTFGMGASTPDHAYPARMAAMLTERTGQQWHAANHGWPGRNSREMLATLGHLLASTRPHFVCILIGVNDAWTRPEELTLEELTIGAESEAAHAAAGFVLTFRLGRLFAAFRAKDAFRDRARSTGDADRERDAEDQAWLGDWGTPDGAIHVRFEKEGRGSLCGAPVHWAIEGDQLEVAVQGSVTWRGRLLATPDALDVTFESGDVLRLIPSLGQSEVEDAWMAAKRGEWRTAADRFEALLQMPSLEATQVRTLRAARIQALCALGDRATASIELDRLRRAHAESGDEASMAALAQGMLFLGQDDEVMVLLERVIPNQPADARLWSSYAALAEKVGSLQDAREATRQAIALSVAAGRRDHGFQLRNLARLHGHEGGEDDCAIHAIEAHLLDDDRPATRQLFSRWPRPFEVRLSALRRAAARVGVEPQVLGDLERLLSEAAGMDKESWIRVSRIHLERAVELCRRSGAEPILATYPFHGDMREAVVAVAADKGCALVALDDVFRRIREQDPGRQLHVADGHCNDAGYAVMAEAIGRVIVARLPPSPSRQGK